MQRKAVLGGRTSGKQSLRELGTLETAEARHTCDHTSGGAESREGQEAVSGQGCGEEVRVQNSRRKLDSFQDGEKEG